MNGHDTESKNYYIMMFISIAVLIFGIFIIYVSYLNYEYKKSHDTKSLEIKKFNTLTTCLEKNKVNDCKFIFD